MLFNFRSIFRAFIWLPLVVIPLLSSEDTLDPSIHIRFIALALYVLFLTTCVLFMHYKKKPIPFEIIKDKLFLLFVVYIFFSSISLFYFNINFSDGLFELLKIVLFPILILLLYLCFYHEEHFISIVSKSITLLALIISFIGLFELMQIASNSAISHESMYMLKATFAHKNIYTEILFTTLPFSLFCIYSCKGMWRIVGGIAAIMALFLIIISFTRAVWIAFALSGILTLSIYFHLNKKEIFRDKRFFYFAFLLILVFSTSILIYSRIGDLTTFYKQGKSITEFKHGSTKDRLVLWEKSLNIVEEHPLIGSGLGSWKIEILKYGNQGLITEDNKTFHLRPHNDYLWILTEQGLFSLIAYLIIIGILYKYLFGLIKYADKQKSVFYLLLFFGFTGYIIYSIFSFPKERIEHLLFFSFTCAMILLQRKKTDATIQPNNSAIPVPLLLGISAFLTIAVVIGYIRFDSEMHTRKAFEYRENQNWKMVVKEINKTNSFFYRLDPMNTPIRWYSGMANFNMNKLQDAFFDFKKSYEVNPFHIHVLNNLGTCYEMTGNHAEAMELYKKAIAISPGFDDALINLCAIYYNAGNSTKAYDTFRSIAIKDSLNGKYMSFLPVIIKAKAVNIINNTSDTLMKNTMGNICRDEKWLKLIYVKSIMNNISFDKQLTIDAIWVLQNSNK